MAKTKITFPAPVRIYTNKETGEEFIIRDNEWFDKRIAEMTADIETGLDVEKKIDPERYPDFEKVKELRIQIATEIIEKNRAKHAKYIQTAKLYDYSIAKPTYGEGQKARDAARVVKSDGTIAYDNDRMVDELIKTAVYDEDGEQVRVMELTSRPLVDELRALLWLSISSDDSRLPNLSAPS